MIKIALMKRTFEPGAVIIREGDPGREAYLVREGFVEISKTDGAKPVLLATRGPGAIIGEMALIDDSPRSAAVTARGRVVVEVITRNDLKGMLEQAPEQLALIIRQLLERLRDANELIAGAQ